MTSVRKLEECLEDQGDPVPADQDKDDGNDEEQIDQHLFQGQFPVCCIKFYHCSFLFVSKGINRIHQSGTKRLVAHG